MKKFLKDIEPVPSKRIFYSIIADYDLSRATCELIDNALDQWVKGGKRSQLAISIDFRLDQQTATITDNAGGVDESDLEILVGPGLTSNEPEDHTIGIFGVGTKRAVVALAQYVQIRSRYKGGQTHLIEFDETWLRDASWKLPVYVTDEIAAGTTQIDLSRLRFKVEETRISELKAHLGATYALFLQNKKVELKVNGDPIKAIEFENWAYPPKYEPQEFSGKLPVDGKEVSVKVLAGLTRESSPASGEYGVYVYCNKRLIGRALKSHQVGFAKGLAGVPHPKVSLVRVIVTLEGEAQLMPWNSTKSGVNYEHALFLSMHDWLVGIVKQYAILSRGWQGSWPDKVFKYGKGSISKVQVADFALVHTYLTPSPRFRQRLVDKVAARNEKIYKDRPWSKGLAEGIVAADLIANARLDARNRIALIVLDSTLEIAFKEYLVNDSGGSYSQARISQLFGNRHDVQAEVKKYKSFPMKAWKKIDYYYNLRCDLVHRKAIAPIPDSDINEFRSTIEKVLNGLFGLEFPS